MRSPRELRPRKVLACHEALDARGDRRRLRNLRDQVNHLTPLRRRLRGAKALEEEMKLLEAKPIAALDFGSDLSTNTPAESSLEADVLHPPVSKTVTVAEVASNPPTIEVVVLEPLATEVMTVADTVSKPLTDEVVAVDPFATEVMTLADTAFSPPAEEVDAVVEAALEPPANEAVDLVEAALLPPDEEFVTFANNFPTYCHQCEDTTWLDLDAHKLAFHKEGKDDEEPSEPPCQRLCTCGRHRIYLASYAPKFGDKPIKSRINKVVIGQRIEPNDIPGLNFWIRTKNDCYVRPHPEDVGTFEHEFLPYDVGSGVDDHISG